jgi:hypothetical protein
MQALCLGWTTVVVTSSSHILIEVVRGSDSHWTLCTASRSDVFVQVLKLASDLPYKTGTRAISRSTWVLDWCFMQRLCKLSHITDLCMYSTLEPRTSSYVAPYTSRDVFINVVPLTSLKVPKWSHVVICNDFVTIFIWSQNWRHICACVTKWVFRHKCVSNPWRNSCRHGNEFNLWRTFLVMGVTLLSS